MGRTTTLLILASGVSALALAQPMLSLITQEGGMEFEDLGSRKVVISPFISYKDAQSIERAVSEAWNYYDARIYWRMMASLYGKDVYCNDDQEDSYLKSWEGKGVEPRSIPEKVRKEDFCDGDIPTNPVPWAPGICPNFYLDRGELTRRYAKVMTHAAQVYHPKYLDAVGAALNRYAPKGVSWPSYRTPGGAFLTPVKNDQAPNWEALVQKALGVLREGRLYVRQAEPGQSPAERSQTLGKTLNPQGTFDPPGVAAVERLKPTVVTRSGVHDQPNYWAGQNGGPLPKGESFTGPPEDYEVYGMGSALYALPQMIGETSIRTPTYTVGCILPTPPFFLRIPISVPIIHATIRVNTAWRGLVEGYPVPLVSGAPSQGVR